MSNVISLTAARDERSPHWSGACVCLGCRHEWAGVGPLGTTGHLDCPACQLPKGVVKHPFGGADGDRILTCKCGSEALTAYIHDARCFVRCMACGTDLTHAFYDG